MRRRWAGLAILLVWSVGILNVHGVSAEPAAPEGLSLEWIARAYPTPQALARFLRQAMTFKTDEELFGEPDHWQSPEAFLSRRAGDCEDYALFAQAVLQQQGIEAHVLSLFGEDGYAHTVCVFKQAGRYHVINRDRFRAYGAKTLETLAWQVYTGWTSGALSRQTGTRGEAIRMFHNPNPAGTHWRSDPLLSFP